MKSTLVKKIIFDYFDGKSSSIQRKMIEEWLKEPQNRELFYQYLDEWEQQHPQYVFDIDSGLKKVYTIIDTASSETVKPTPDAKEINFSPYVGWLVAASISIAIVSIGWLKTKHHATVSYKNLVENTRTKTGEIYEKENLTLEPILVNLPDKSSIILQPKSKISYSPKQYNKTKREVILAGEAFFEVQKDSKKPFFVYTNELITKVLGTSFSVKAHPSTAEIEVIVKTGKVAVFLQRDVDKNTKLANNALEGLVLTENEKVRINRDDYTISKPVVVSNDYLKLPIEKLSFNFDDTPVSDVINDLEKAYSIQIIYDHDKLASCKLTASLSDEPLMEKIKLICIALEASYEEADNKIILKAKGCK